MVLQKGNRGVKVRELQRLLNNKGYVLSVDGEFGMRTLAALKAFQKNHLLLVDGIAGPATFKELKSDPRALKEIDYHRAAEELGVDVATVKAVTQVEAAGSGFQSDGRIKILFEGHKFWEELNKIYGNAKLKETPDTADILYEKWTKKYYRQDQHDRLHRASLIHKEAAERSTSWGMFQIMGFNHLVCGFAEVGSFVRFNKQNEGNQLLCFVRFCLGNHLHTFLQQKDWGGFARRYNGPAYKKNKYDTKLAAAYKKFS